MNDLERKISKWLYITNDERLASYMRTQCDMPKVTAEIVAKVRLKAAKRSRGRPYVRKVAA